MRVLLISHTYVVRVNQPKLHELAALPDVKLRVIVPQFWPEGLHGNLNAEKPENAKFDFLPLPTILTGRGSRYMHRSLTMTMRKFHPDIICIEEGWRGLTTFQVALYKRLWAPRARLIFFTWENIFRPVPRWQAFVPRFNLRQINYGISGNEDGVAVARAGGYRGPLEVVPQLGIDTAIFYPQDSAALRQELGLAPDAFVVGFVARMVPEKGLTVLLEAAAQAGLTGEWKLLLIGNGSDRENAERRAQELGIAGQIKWIGAVPHAELAHYYNTMDVLVSPSITTPSWKEQFGLAVAQAMACGKAVVGSTCGETPTLMGEAGLVFEEGDARALAKHLSHLQHSEELREELGRKGVERIRSHFSFAGIARRTHQIWEKALHA